MYISYISAPVPSKQLGAEGAKKAVEAASAGHGRCLLFAAGDDDVRELQRHVAGAAAARGIDDMPIHAITRDSSPESFRRALHPPLQGRGHGVVIAMNKMETTYTLENLPYVVDLGWKKEMRYDP